MQKEKNFCVIEWNAENIYRVVDAVGSYCYESAAQKACDKMNKLRVDCGQPAIFVVRIRKYMRGA